MPKTGIKNYKEKRIILLTDQNYCCASCGELFEIGDKIDLSHKIPKTKANIKKYGLEIIDNIDNLAATHSNGKKGKSCNDSMIINPATRPIEAEEHINKIRSKLNN